MTRLLVILGCLTPEFCSILHESSENYSCGSSKVLGQAYFFNNSNFLII